MITAEEARANTNSAIELHHRKQEEMASFVAETICSQIETSSKLESLYLDWDWKYDKADPNIVPVEAYAIAGLVHSILHKVGFNVSYKQNVVDKRIEFNISWEKKNAF